LRVPRQPLFPLAYAAEAIARVTGKEPFITTDGLRMAKHRMYFSSAKAERELGYKARPYASAVGDAIGWFRLAGYIR
jgi:dihydroflavonol-4-reductase